jgi:hypothetical protein
VAVGVGLGQPAGGGQPQRMARLGHCAVTRV